MIDTCMCLPPAFCTFRLKIWCGICKCNLFLFKSDIFHHCFLNMESVMSFYRYMGWNILCNFLLFYFIEKTSTRHCNSFIIEKSHCYSFEIILLIYIQSKIKTILYMFSVTRLVGWLWSAMFGSQVGQCSIGYWETINIIFILHNGNKRDYFA